MSFLTSFWFFPQKEQERFPCSSRFRSVGTGQKRSTDPPRKSAPLSAVRPPAFLPVPCLFLACSLPVPCPFPARSLPVSCLRLALVPLTIRRPICWRRRR